MNTLVFRKAAHSDIDSLVACRILMLNEESPATPTNITDSLLDFYQTHLNGDFIAWVAADAGKIVATSGLTLTAKPPYYGNPSGKIGILSHMYTDPAYRRAGVAKQLIGFLIEEAKSRGCNVLHVSSSAMGIPLYEHIGFVRKDNFLEYRVE